MAIRTHRHLLCMRTWQYDCCSPSLIRLMFSDVYTSKKGYSLFICRTLVIQTTLYRLYCFQHSTLACQAFWLMPTCQSYVDAHLLPLPTIHIDEVGHERGFAWTTYVHKSVQGILRSLRSLIGATVLERDIYTEDGTCLSRWFRAAWRCCFYRRLKLKLPTSSVTLRSLGRAQVGFGIIDRMYFLFSKRSACGCFRCS